MRILGHGIDIFELHRAELHLASQYPDWVESIFTCEEQSQADPPPNVARYFAGRYAAKEAIAKALGTGFSDDVAWQDIEVLRLQNGGVRVVLRCGALAVAERLGIQQWFVTISHGGDYAVASAIASGV